jgi:hypothetical protein
MTHQTEPLALLRDTEHYLSALHGSVARHDNLAANYGCAGCELRDRITAAVSAAVAPPTDRAAVLHEAADALGCMDYDTDSNDYGYDTYRDAWNGGVMDAADRLRRMADETATQTPAAVDLPTLAAELRRMADETATQTPAPDDRNAGPGWYEVITSPQATTCIAYVHEDGSLYLPEGDLTEEEFAFAAARGKAHRLVRADEQPAAGARQDGAES